MGRDRSSQRVELMIAAWMRVHERLEEQLSLAEQDYVRMVCVHPETGMAAEPLR